MGLLKLSIYVAQAPVPRRPGRRAGRPVPTRRRSFADVCSVHLYVPPPLNIALNSRRRRLHQNVSEGKPALLVSRPLFSVPQRALRDGSRARRDPSLGGCNGRLHRGLHPSQNAVLVESSICEIGPGRVRQVILHGSRPGISARLVVPEPDCEDRPEDGRIDRGYSDHTFSQAPSIDRDLVKC